jgi:DUF2959 family protein
MRNLGEPDQETTMDGKGRKVWIGAATIAILALALAAPGPAWGADSSGQKGKAKAVEKMSEFRAGLEGISNQIDVTLGALTKVADTAASDPRPAFTEFCKAHDTMAGMIKDIRSEAQDLQKNSQKLFDAWQKQMGTMTNPDIKAKAEERKAALMGFFDKVKASMQAGKDAGGPFASDLKDIRTYLTNDLTPAGINMMKDTIAKANTNGGTVKSSIGEVLAAVDAFKAEISPTGTPAK